MAENSDLTKKLAEAEKTIREVSEDKPKKEQEIADVRRQVEQLRQQLAASQKQNQEFEVTVADLRSQLDETSSELQKAKLTGTNPEETQRLTKENEMLRSIVMRERQEEARRDQARKLMMAEFNKLQIKSETLNKQIELLAQPVVKLSAEELALAAPTGGRDFRQRQPDRGEGELRDAEACRSGRRAADCREALSRSPARMSRLPSSQACRTS